MSEQHVLYLPVMDDEYDKRKEILTSEGYHTSVASAFAYITKRHLDGYDNWKNNVEKGLAYREELTLYPELMTEQEWVLYSLFPTVEEDVSTDTSFSTYWLEHRARLGIEEVRPY